MKNPFKLDKVAVRLVDEPPLLSKEPLNSAGKVIELLADEIRQYDREVIAIIHTHADGKPINMTIASMGELSGAMACPRELLKAAILSNASGMIMLHNHVSGNLNPSYQDINLTDKMKMVCDLVGIRFLDHIIVGREKEYFSFHEMGILTNTDLQLASGKEEINLKSENNSTIKRLEDAINQSKESGYTRKTKSLKREEVRG